MIKLRENMTSPYFIIENVRDYYDYSSYWQAPTVNLLCAYSWTIAVAMAFKRTVIVFQHGRSRKNILRRGARFFELQLTYGRT